MSEARRLVTPHQPEDPTLMAQLLEILSQASRDAGGYVVPHGDEHAFVVVFGAHQAVVTIAQH
jgi:hypothetical protein